MEKNSYKKVLTIEKIGVNIKKNRAKRTVKNESKKYFKKNKKNLKKVLTKYDTLC